MKRKRKIKMNKSENMICANVERIVVNNPQNVYASRKYKKSVELKRL